MPNLFIIAQTFKNKLVIITLFSCISILSCTTKKNTYNYSQAPQQSNLKETNSDNSTKLNTQQIQGKLIYEKIPPIKSIRAYTGEEFFLMTNSKNKKKLVLLSSEKVSLLQSFHNQEVEITAIYKKGTRPDGLKSSCPLDSDGQCMIQGQGYQVLSIVTK